MKGNGMKQIKKDEWFEVHRISRYYVNDELN